MELLELVKLIKNWIREKGLTPTEGIRDIASEIMEEDVGMLRSMSDFPILSFTDGSRSGKLTLSEETELKSFHEKYNRNRLDPKHEPRFVALLDKRTAFLRAGQKGGAE